MIHFGQKVKDNLLKEFSFDGHIKQHLCWSFWAWYSQLSSHFSLPFMGGSEWNVIDWIGIFSLQWRYNEHDGVSNHQPHDCLLNRLFRQRSKKISKLRVTGLCEGNSPGTGEFHAQKASNAENVTIWWRHHVSLDTTAFIYPTLPVTMTTSLHENVSVLLALSEGNPLFINWFHLRMSLSLAWKGCLTASRVADDRQRHNSNVTVL